MSAQQLYGGLKATSSKKAYATCCVMHVCCSLCPFPHVRPPKPPQETLKHRSTLKLKNTQTQKHSNSASMQSLGPGANKVCLSSLSILVCVGFHSKCNFAPPTIFLGLLLCPWRWGISSKSLQRHAAASPAPCSHHSSTMQLQLQCQLEMF